MSYESSLIISKTVNIAEKYLGQKMCKILLMDDTVNFSMNSMASDGIIMSCFLCIPANPKISIIVLSARIIVSIALVVSDSKENNIVSSISNIREKHTKFLYPEL